MKKSNMKNIVPLMAMLIMLMVCGCLIMMTTIKPVKSASDFSSVPEVAENGGFSEGAGASICVIDGANGIRFTTTLTREYHNSLKEQGEVSYISVMTGNGVSVEKPHEYNFDAYFANNDKLEMFASLRFNKDNSQITDWAKVYGWDFTVDTYALVGGNPVAKATESDTIRSMREVANTSYYTDDNENDFYQDEDLKNEYLSGLKEVNTGYTDTTTNTTILNIEGATFNGKNTYVYDGTGDNAKRVEASVDNGNLKIKDELTGTSGKEFTVFDDNNKAFRVKTALGTEIKDLATLGVLNAATTGNYFLSSDITMTGSWVNTNPANFTGVFDGMGHAIKNLSTTGLFKGFAGTIKNVAFENASFSNHNAGIIANTMPTNTTSVVENVAIKIKSDATYGNCGAITRVIYNGTNLIMRNSIIEMNKLSNDTNQKGFIAGFIHPQYSQVSPVNCYFITNNMLPTGLRGGDWMGSVSQLTNETLSDTTPAYTNFNVLFTKNGQLTNTSHTLVNIEEGISRTMKNSFNDALKKTYAMYTEIDGKTHIYNAKDLEVLKTETTGTFVLENDIDMAGYTDGTNEYWTNANATAFAGVFNGQGYVIKNLKTTSLFKYLGGTATVKNVGFIDASYVGGGNGILADRVNNHATAVVSNVIITGVEVPSGATWTGAIARQLQEAAKVTLENVLFEVKLTSTSDLANNGIAFGIANYSSSYVNKITATNCYLVSNGMTPIASRTTGGYWNGGTANTEYWGEGYANVFGTMTNCNFALTEMPTADSFTADMKALYDYMNPTAAENN